MSEKEIRLLKHLRCNSRTSLSEISRKTEIPVSTLHNMMPRLAIKKHTALLDFSKLGYPIKVQFLLKSAESIMDADCINSIFKIKEGFMLDCYFKNLSEMHQFKEKIKNDYLEETLIYEELSRETFLN